jgi:alanyl-tRNA synthetase
MPSNEGRGYVLRRIIRRAIRFGQVLDIREPFLHRIAGKVIEVMGPDYRELTDSRSYILGVIENEEKRFSDTLVYGMRVLEDNLAELQERNEHTIPGDLAFKLYDTYGLSVDIVQDVARQEGLTIDMDGYESAMAGQRAKSQQSWKGSGEEEIPEIYRKVIGRKESTLFTGYGELNTRATVKSIVLSGEPVPSIQPGDEAEILLDRTPFYGESGGQVGDTGWISRNGTTFLVTQTRKIGQDLIVHQGKLESGTLQVDEEVDARVDGEKRASTARNHSATHLLHAALREVLGDHVKQAGSLVSPDRLRFDFSHFAQVDPDKLHEVETLVNRHILANLPISVEEMALEEAMKTGAMAIFEERYGEQLRLVRVEDGVSLELCGGTHTHRTGDIGLFKILSESAVGANLRRIEAVTGLRALGYVQDQDRMLRAVSGLLKSAPDQVEDRVKRLLGDLKQGEKELESLQAKLRTNQSGDLASQARDVNGITVLASQVAADSPKVLRELADQLKEKVPSGIILLAADSDGKAMLICLVTKDLTDRFKAGAIIGRLSPLLGGKGGGRPDMAQGGGNQPEKIPQAIQAIYDLVKEGGG